MRILILSQWFPPEPRPLFWEMAKGLQGLGHDVQVVTGFPNWPGGKLYPGYKMRFAARETLDGVAVLRLPLYPDHSHSRIKRILNLTSLALSFAVQAPFRLRRPDVIHVVQLPTLAISAWYVSRLWKAPMTLEVQDIWPETLAATGMMNSRRVLAAVNSMCDSAYRRATVIRVISNGFRSNLLRKRVPVEKIRVIENWSDADEIQPMPPDREFTERFGTNGRFVVLYAGSVGLPQALHSVLEAAELLKKTHPRVLFLIAGEGVDLRRLKQIAKERNLDSVRFIGSFPSSAMNRIYSLSDVNLVHLRDDPLFEITIPHKILTYLAAGKPILAGVTGDAADLVESSLAGIVCTPESPRSIADGVACLYSKSPEEKRVMGEFGRKAATGAYAPSALIPKLEQMLKDAVELHRGKR